MDRATAALPSSDLVLARYRPLRPLGSGSSGSVWLARDERTGLDVALKVVPKHGKSGARAEREAGAAARLRHPCCQRVYEHASDGSHHYIAYEYVPGVTLREATRAGRLSDAEAVEAAAQVLEGLAHAHARGIVHRDVKPANVLLADGPDVSVRLLDFGMARFAEADTLTAAGDVPGTLAYIAPERLGGEAASPASDVWAVGVMLWEALAGRHPFWAPSLVATSQKIEAGAPPLAKARPDLPRALVATIEQALELDPMRRAPAGELAKRLRQASRQNRERPSGAEVALPAPTTLPLAVERAVPALLAGLFAGWTAAELPFFPASWPAGLGLLAAALTLLSARAGLAFALAVPILPLGNLSLGLALLYAGLACIWFALHYPEPRSALMPVLGPVLAPLSAFGALPLVLQPVRAAWRRALHAATAVCLAAIAAGLRGVPLPFSEAHARTLGLDSTRSPLVAASDLRHALFAHPSLLIAGLVLGAAAASLPAARKRGLWGLAVFGALLLAGTILPAPSSSPIPLVIAVWSTCVALALWDRRRTRG